MTISYQPVFLIGAARSGTKVLRDVIERHPAVDKVPYDINYIWRIGHEDAPDDRLTTAALTPAITAQIRSEVERFHAGAPILIEKTVSKCLRVSYVATIFPQAKFVHLIRDGIDVIESVHRQWTAPPDWRYLLQKSRTFPLRRAPRYAVKYAGGLFKRMLTQDAKQLPTWGPRYHGIEQDMQRYSLLEVCALQWAHCVHDAEASLASLAPERVHTVRYEEFVQDPLAHLTALAHWLAIPGMVPGS